MNRRLYRCDHDRKIAGVAAGVAEYFDVDVSLVRILWVLSIFFGGFGILLYIAMALIVPLEPIGMPRGGWAAAGGPVAPGAEGAGGSDAWGAPEGAAAGAAGESATQPGVAGVPGGWAAVGTPHRHAGHGGSGLGVTFFGLALVLFGGLALLDQLLPAWADQGRFLWPAFILGIGALLVATSVRRQQHRT